MTTIGTQLAIETFVKIARAKRRIENLEEELKRYLVRNDFDMAEYVRETERWNI